VPGRSRSPGQHRPTRNRKGQREVTQSVVRGTWYVVRGRRNALRRTKNVVRGTWYVVRRKRNVLRSAFDALRRRRLVWPVACGLWLVAAFFSYPPRSDVRRRSRLFWRLASGVWRLAGFRRTSHFPRIRIAGRTTYHVPRITLS
jgi:hypothetical protein